MEPDPLQDPQPVKIVEERRDVFILFVENTSLLVALSTDSSPSRRWPCRDAGQHLAAFVGLASE